MSARARYHCCSLQRRNEVDAHATLNGLEALEVVDRDLPSTDPLRQRTLVLYFLKSIATAGFTRDNIRITGGERMRNPAVEWAEVAPASTPLSGPAEAATKAVVAGLTEPDKILVVRVRTAGDYSPYTLRLVQSATNDAPPPGFDSRMVEIEFSFKAECPSELDCLQPHACPPAGRTTPDVDYLARDYATFRQLLLDRLAHQVPDWRERSAADVGIAIVELLAYVGDHLSYRQDAIATEAYLGTARKRVSVRRHVRLVDYEMHDGCNARTFVHLRMKPGPAPLGLPSRSTRFLTRCDRIPRAITTGSIEEQEAKQQRPIVFEPVLSDWYDASVKEKTTLRADHNEMRFYTWSDEECCLPAGATRATLRGKFPHLKDEYGWLLIEEVKGPRTGVPEDADTSHRQVVRVLSADVGVDPVPTSPVDITEIEWASEDALTFPVCISAKGADDRLLTDISVARGNLVLVDHGETQLAEDLGVMPAARVLHVAHDTAHCKSQEPQEVPARYRPTLELSPVTQASPVTLTSARAALRSGIAGTRPSLKLTGTFNGNDDDWPVQRSLLNSSPNQGHVMLEVESDGIATLRFGDGTFGQRPAALTRFSALYRTGNGSTGNVGAEAIAHVVGGDVMKIDFVRNPVSAEGGTEPEEIDNVRRRAPEAFRTQKRAVTPADYTDRAQRHTGVERASSRMRWTGSWHTMFVTADRTGGAPLDKTIRDSLNAHLDGYRMAGHDIALEEPLRVSLELSLHVCVEPDYFRADVRRALLDLFSGGIRRDGSKGLFHPDRFSFGDTVYLSPLIAAARRVAGVASVSATAFGRQGDEDLLPLEEGRLVLGAREIARLDNDPNFREHGALTLELHGGK